MTNSTVPCRVAQCVWGDVKAAVRLCVCVYRLVRVGLGHRAPAPLDGGASRPVQVCVCV